LPYAVDYMLSIMLHEIGLGSLGDAVSNVTNEQAKTFALNTITEVFAILLELNTNYNEFGENVYQELSDDVFSSIALQDLNINIFTSLGKIIDGIIDLVDEDSYSEVVGAVADQTKELLNPMFAGLIGEDRSAVLTGNIANAIKEADRNSWFAKEFKAIGTMFNYLFVGETVVGSDGVEEQVTPLIGGKHNLSDPNNWTYEINDFATLGKLVNAMQQTSMFKYQAENSKLNNLTNFVDSLLLQTKENILSNIEQDGDIVKDEDGYITAVTTVDGMLYNMLNNIEINLVGHVKSDGSFDWTTALPEGSLFVKTINAILKADGEKLYNIGSDGSIIKIKVI